MAYMYASPAYGTTKPLFVGPVPIVDVPSSSEMVQPPFPLLYLAQNITVMGVLYVLGTVKYVLGAALSVLTK